MYQQECIMVDSTLVIRMYVNPPGKGRFEYTLNLLLGNETIPRKITLKGFMLEAPVYESSALTNCPDFRNPVLQKPSSEPIKLTVVTIDRLTRKIVPGTQVSMTRNGEVFWSKPTGEDGKIKERGVSGLFFFYAIHPNYEPEEKGVSIGKEQNFIILELTRTVSVAPNNQPEFDSLLTDVPFNDSLPPSGQVFLDTLTTFTSLDTEDFDSAYFMPVNLVFVLDISGSMGQEGKLALMKTALHRLVDILRPEDRIGLVVYADKATTVMPSTTGNQKEAIRKAVKTLSCGGYTAGGAGIALGYEVLRSNFIPNGRNELIIITDGAFNKGTEAYKSIVLDNAKEELCLSVIGIKNKAADLENMRNMAQTGKGVFVSIDSERAAQQDVNWEIRKRAFRVTTD